MKTVEIGDAFLNGTQGSRIDLLAGFGGGSGTVSTGGTVVGGIIQGGFDILGDLISSKFGGISGGGGVQDPGFLPVEGGLQTVGMAAIGPAILQAGGRIVGTIIHISKAGWAAVPSLIKQAALALGLTVALTDVGLPDVGGFLGGNGGLTDAQEKRLNNFRRYIDAGMTPKQAARSAGLDRRPKRGITHAQLRGFSKVSGMLAKWGMVPRKLRGAKRRRVCK